MPRRKRKSIDAKKAPLEFEESPFSGTFNPPSPVFCSDNPATADVVQVSEDLPVPWVSPQFSKVPNSLTVAKKERRSRRLANKTVDVNSTTVVTPNHRTRKHVNSKVVPLRFHGDKTPEPPSIIEEISYDENTPPVAKDLHADQTCKGRLNREGGPLDNCNQYRHGNKMHPSINYGHIAVEDKLDTSISPVPVTKTKTGKKEVVKRRTKPGRLKINLDDLFSDDSDISLLAAHGRKHGSDAARNNRSLKEINGLPYNKSLLENISTPQTPKTSHRTDHGISGISKNTHCDINDPHNVPLEPVVSDAVASPKIDHDNNLSSLRLNISTPTLSSRSDKISQSDKLYGSFLTPERKRRSLRLVNMFLPSTPIHVPMLQPSHNILAYDTPEEDYGLPVRKRYLKGIVPLKMKKLKQFTSN